jgi:hypothetical protein
VFPHNCRDLNDLTNINPVVAISPTVDSSPHFTISDPASEQKPEEPRMIGDFDGSSNALWTLFRDEAKSHDDARIVTLKDDMEGSLIFVRSYLTYPICAYDGLGCTDLWSHRPVYFPLSSLHS